MSHDGRPASLAGRLVALVEGANRLAGLGAGLILLAMVLMIAREAIGRYFFNRPTDWVVELSGCLLVGPKQSRLSGSPRGHLKNTIHVPRAGGVMDEA